MLTWFTPYRCTSITSTQTEPALITNNNRAPFPLSSRPFHYTQGSFWRCRGISGCLARGTRDLSPVASRRFPMVLGDTVGTTYAQISSLVAVRAATAARTMHRSWRASVLRGRPEIGLQVWECSIDNAESSGTPRYIVPNMCSNLSICPSSFTQTYNATPFKWLKLLNRST